MQNEFQQPLVSVIMPVYKQAHFMRRAVNALRRQAFTQWELIIINDGSTDDTHEIAYELMTDDKIFYHRNMVNTGLGAALNVGLHHARGQFIAYLPADDLIYQGHLATLVASLLLHTHAPLAYASVRHHYNKVAEKAVNDEWLQLVQVMHRRTEARWLERQELESDDLHRLFWHNLEGHHVATGSVSCEWVDHPAQRHKLMREPVGGINPFKVHYRIQQPLRFHSSTGNYIDELNAYAGFRERADTHRHERGLKIVLVGELAYNAERVLALEEAVTSSMDCG